MTNQEKLIRANSILRRQNSGKITKWQASAEMDKLLDKATGDLHFYSDTTALKDVWDGQEVLVFSHKDSNLSDPSEPSIPSNTGIITQGEKRGLVVLKPGETETNAISVQLELWGKPGQRKFNPDEY